MERQFLHSFRRENCAFSQNFHTRKLDEITVFYAVFDIKDFYPSITQDLLKKAPDFATEYINILKYDIDFIHHARESLLFNGSHTWIKKQGGLFEVTVGAHDGAEVCELVDTYNVKFII